MAEHSKSVHEARYRLNNLYLACLSWSDRPAASNLFLLPKCSISCNLGCRKETHCEFCQQRLPDWRDTLTPTTGCSAPAIMNVNFNGRTYSFEVKPGPEGYREFTEAIRKAFSLPEESELNITFTCDEPSSGEVQPGAYSALEALVA